MFIELRSGFLTFGGRGRDMMANKAISTINRENTSVYCNAIVMMLYIYAFLIELRFTDEVLC